MSALGVISAGGRSSRFGSPKALAMVGGLRVVDRAAAALRTVTGAESVCCIANDAALADAIGLPWRPDALPGIGALAGVHAGLLWARERGAHGAIVVGCDMPFVAAPLLRELLARSDDADLVIPASDGPRGVEPLCAWYGDACVEAIEAAAARGDARMIGFHDAVRVVKLPLDAVRQHGDPARIFLNLNTPEDLAAAQAMEDTP
jgi:molybdopterin-guanine dinucleotide biosynthesis protein A